MRDIIYPSSFTSSSTFLCLLFVPVPFSPSLGIPQTNTSSLKKKKKKKCFPCPVSASSPLITASAISLHMTADSVACSDAEQSSAVASLPHTHTNSHTHKVAQCCWSRRRSGWFLAEGNKLHTVCPHMYAIAHALALTAKLEPNGISSLTYFFTVARRETLGRLNINSAERHQDKKKERKKKSAVHVNAQE